MTSPTTKPTLYLMLGYPGAGKTVTADVIAKKTGAVHIWADHERRHRYGSPTLSQKENLHLYGQLNSECAEYLQSGNDVIFDAAFNLYEDRERLRQIAKENGAVTKILWVLTSKELARQRATNNAHLQDSRVLGNMSHEHFDRISQKLEPPHHGEKCIELDGTKITPDYVAKKLGL